MRARRLLPALAMTGVTAVMALGALADPTPAAAEVTAVNPVRVELPNGQPANSGFLVFIEGDVFLNADESEGTLALGGDLSFGSTYNIQAGGSPIVPTYTAPGDSNMTYLHVGGGIDWSRSGDSILRVLDNGFTKVADATTYTAGNVDTNNALSLYQIRQSGLPYGSLPRIEGTTNAQDGISIATPVPDTLIDIPAVFEVYRTLTFELAECAATIELTNPDTGADLEPGWPPGTRGRVTLIPGETNVLELSATDFDNLAEISFANLPSADTPLLVNVTGTSFDGTTPNFAGISGSQAPYILWNFPSAATITVSGGDSFEGTIYAPYAALNWVPTQNIEGNVIAASFAHGPTAFASSPGVREIHDFPFAAELSCANDNTTTTTSTTTTSTTTTSTTVPASTTSTSSTSTTTSTSSSSTSSSTVAPTTTDSGIAGGGEELPATGSGGPGVLPWALVAIVVGSGLVAITRRSSFRRRPPTR